MKPTPLPWHLEEQYRNEYIICDKYNNVICVLRGGFQYKSDEIIGRQEKADGEFILKVVDLLIEARDRITLECYGRKPAPETVKTMKKINKWLGD